ncbi:MAG: contractile injection system protein, VgrG/Pvc8 family [Bryobacterales bacterium]|nr:contractile injection system protein, VgrG/Pvc8 family [Bryobacterales bacterium]
MKPVFQIVIDGRQDITDLARDRWLALTVTDQAGRLSDSAELRLDNRDGAIRLPPRGAKMTVSLGYEGAPAVVSGTYTVDEFEMSGPPATLAIRAKGADMRGELKAQKTRSWDDVSLGDLVGEIAGDHGLKARVGAALRAQTIPHLDQTEESDLHLLTRLAKDRDAVAKQAGEWLLFVPRGEASSATGKPMPRIEIRPGDTKRWRVTIADREAYASVNAHWHDPETGERRTETAGSGSPARTLRQAYASASEAAAAAKAELARSGRDAVTLFADLTPGNPSAAAEAELRTAGFGDGIDGSWTCRRVVHTLDRRGYSTAVEAELKDA